MALQQFFLENHREGRKVPVFNTRRNDIDRLTRTEFRERLRISPESYAELHHMLEPRISPQLPHNHAVPSHTRLQATLRFFAQGSMLQSNADCYGVSKASMSGFINLVTDAIVDKMDEFIFWPRPDAMITSKAGFYDMGGIPSILGCIDCTHVNITGLPSDIEHAYVNRKGNHSVNIQAVCDSDRIFTDVVARWPGSCHDNHILNNSTVKANLDDHRLGHGWLLGDSGYPCLPYLLTPYIHNNMTPQQQMYNRAHKKTRVTIECAFGDLKARFRCLNKQGGALYYEPRRACRIITACMCLHNLCKRRGDADFIVDLAEQQLGVDAGAELNEPEAGRAVRDNLVRQLFG